MIRWNWVGFLPTCILFVLVFPRETLPFVCRFDLFFLSRGKQRLVAFSASHVNKQVTRNRIYLFFFRVLTTRSLFSLLLQRWLPQRTIINDLQQQWYDSNSRLYPRAKLRALLFCFSAQNLARASRFFYSTSSSLKSDFLFLFFVFSKLPPTLLSRGQPFLQAGQMLTLSETALT